MTHIDNTEMHACLLFSFNSISPPKLHTSKFTLCSTPQTHPLSMLFQKEIICKSKLKQKKVKVSVARWCPTLCVYSSGQSTAVGSLSLLQGNLPDPGIKPKSPALPVDSLLAEPQGKPKNTTLGSLSLLQRIFLTQESNRGLLHCRRILYQLTEL